MNASAIAAACYPALTKGGPHAYGWVTSRGTPGTMAMAKYAGRADTETASRNIAKMDADARILIAHTRWATHGSPLVLANNHPIHHGNIVGVHNGVLTNSEKILTTTGRSDSTSEVDSEAIFAAVNKWGPQKGLRKIAGTMVAVYLDLRWPNMVSIARSYGRPLIMAWTKAGSIFFASEQQALMQLGGIVGFDHFSHVMDFRYLRVRDGKIIQRATYSSAVAPEPAPRIAPVVRSFAPAAHVERGKPYTSRVHQMLAEIELRHGVTRITDRVKDHLAEDFEPDIVNSGRPISKDANLYFYRGRYLSAAEYIAMVEDDLEWDEFDMINEKD